MDASASNRFALQRINRSLNCDEAAAIIGIKAVRLLHFENGRYQRLSERQLVKILRWERRWAYEEIRRAILGRPYEHRGTLTEEFRIRVASERRKNN